MSQVTMKQLLEAGVHFGHQTSRWNPKMRPYIFGARNGIHIIDLQQTVNLFRDACEYVREAVAGGGTVLFVGTKKQAQDPIQSEARRCGHLYVNTRWLGGTLTNFQTIKQSIDRLKRLEETLADPESSGLLKKKERLMMQREVDKLTINLQGIRDMKKLPDVVFVVDPDRESIGVNEANRLKIPVVAVVDTNCDPDRIAYCIPGNDDAIRAIRLFCEAVAEAVIAGTEDLEERRRASAAESGLDVGLAEGVGTSATLPEAEPPSTEAAAASDGAATDSADAGAKAEPETAAAPEPTAPATSEPATTVELASGTTK